MSDTGKRLVPSQARAWADHKKKIDDLIRRIDDLETVCGGLRLLEARGVKMVRAEVSGGTAARIYPLVPVGYLLATSEALLKKSRAALKAASAVDPFKDL